MANPYLELEKEIDGAATASAPSSAPMDLGVTEPLPKGPVTQPLEVVRASGEPGGEDLLAQAKALSRQVTTQAVERAAAPNPYLELEAEIEDEKDSRIYTLYGASLTRSPDEHAAVKEISRRTGIKASIIEERLPEFQKKMEAAGYDARKFRQTAPDLSELILENPDVAPVAFHDENLGFIGKAFRALRSQGPGAKPPWATKSTEASFFNEGIIEPIVQESATEEGDRVVQTPTGRFVQREGEWVKQNLQQESPLAGELTKEEEMFLAPAGRVPQIIKETFVTAQKQIEHSMLAADLADARAFAEKSGKPVDTWEIERKMLDLKTEMGQRWYNAGPIEQLGLDAAEILPSQIQTYKGAGIGAGVGAVVAGGATLAATRSPLLARQAAMKGAAVGSRPGVFLAVQRMEYGSAYADFVDVETDSGQKISEPVARNCAAAYSFVAAGIEVAFFPAALRMFGPLGDAIASGSGKSVALGLLRNAGSRKILADAGKRILSGAVAEGKEEFYQQLAQDLSAYIGRSYSGGIGQQADLVGSLEAGFEAGSKAFRGTLVLGGGGGVVNLSTQSMANAYHRDQSYRAGEQVAALAQVAENSTTARAAPDVVAELVRRESEKSGDGDPVTHVYVDAAAFSRLFQGEGPTADEAAAELMGEEGPQKLKEALTGAHDGKIEVPVAEYLERWGGEKIASTLAQDTTVRPGLLTQREQIQQDEQIATRRKELVAEYQKENAPAPESEAERRLVEAVGAQLGKTGIYKPAEARKAVALTRAFLRTQAEVAGTDPDTLFADYALTVEQENTQARPEGTLTQMAAVRESEQPEAPTDATEELRERWRGLTLEQRLQEMFRDPGTGLLNERAFRAQPVDPSRPMVAHISVEGVKYANRAGHEVGDALYTSAAHALASVAPDTAKVGGDFAVRVKDQAELDSLLARANEAMQAQGFALTGALGPDLAAAQAENIAQKEGLEGQGKRAKRGRRPKGLRALSFGEFLKDVWKGPTAEVVGTHLAAVQDTVISESLRQAFAQMPADKAFEAVHVDPRTGFLTGPAFKALDPKKYVVSLDLNKLKRINKEHGDIGGDLIIAEFVRLAKERGGPDFDFAHFSGDEFAAQSNDPVAIQAFIDDLGDMCDDVSVKFPDGKTQQGIAFGYGIGDSYAKADQAVESSKGFWARKRERSSRGKRLADRNRAQDRQRSGLDQGRGDLRRGIPIPGAEGIGQALEQVGPRLAQAAYHGTPHRFSQFTLDHLGSGEGTQFEGWGLYFTGDKGIGEWYRRGLSDVGIAWAPGSKGVNLAMSEEQNDAYDQLREIFVNKQWSGNKPGIAVDLWHKLYTDRVLAIEASIVGVENRLKEKPRDFTLKGDLADRKARLGPARDLAAWVAQFTVDDFKFQQGQLYKVDIPSDSDLIDWRSPVKNQPEIIAKLKNAGILSEDGHQQNGALLGNATGEDLYQDIGAKAPIGMRPDEFASKELLKAGIPGNKYENGQGTGFNYVIWDESAIKVLKTFYQGNRGYVDQMRDGVKRLFRVVLTDKADLSTFLHESSHIFLSVMGDLATKEGAAERLKQDWQKTLDWLGAKDYSELTVEQQEKWAGAFETYLREGKAPSADLVGAFQRFKIWLTQIYKALAPGDIDDEIRGVFDRMLATDDEIARMQRAMGADRTLFKSPDEAGMSPSEYQAYLEDKEKAFARATAQTQKRVIKEQIKATETVLREERRRALVDAGEEYDARPEVVAHEFLTKGQTGENMALDALLVEAGSAPGLNRETVMLAVGNDVFKAKFRGLTENGGLDPDELADIVGAPDGPTLVKLLAERPNKVEWSAARAEELLAERTGDVEAERQRLKDAAAKALHSQGNSDWLLKEWQALRRRRGEGGAPAPLESIRLAARDIVEATPVKALRPGHVLQAERSASNRAAIAAAKGNWKEAALEKQKQVLNHYIHRETTQALENREKFERLADKLTDRKRRSALGKAGKAFVDAADSILEALGFAEPEADPAALADRKTTPEWMQALEDQGILPSFAGDRLSAIVANPPTDWRDLSVADVEMIRTALSQLYRAARDVNQVMLLGQRVQIQQVLNQIADESAYLPSQPAAPASESQRTIWNKARQTIQGVDAVLKDPELLLRRLGDTARRFFWDRYTDQRAVEDRLAEKVLKFFLEGWDDLPAELQKRRFEPLPAAEAAKLKFPADVRRDVIDKKGTVRIDRSWMWMLALNTGNQSNLDRLLGGYEWDEQTVRDFLAKNMTDEEWDFVESVWDLMDKELYPDVAAQYESANGIKPKKIEALPFTLPSGRVIRGGYFPARYDPVASRLGEKQREEALSTIYNQKAGQYAVSKGFTKERAKTYEDVISLQWAEVPRHVAQVIHYIAFDGYIRDAGRVMAGLQNTVGERLGDKYYPQLEQWLRVVASPVADMTPEHLGPIVKFLGGLRSRFVISTLGYSLTVTAGDLTNAMVAISSGKIKSRFAIPGHARVIVDWAKVRALSPELQHRSTQWRTNMRRHLMQVGPAGQKSTVLEGVRESAWWMMEQTDRLMSTIIWKGAYDQALAAKRYGGKELSQAEAVRDADSIVRSMLPTHDPAEQPAILRDKRGVGSLIAFYGYFSKLYNLQSETIAPARIAWQTAEGAGEKVKTLPTAAQAAGRVLATIIVTELFAELFSGRGPEDEEKWGEWAVRKALAAPGMYFPLVGQVWEQAVNFGVSETIGSGAKYRKPSVRASPAAAAFERMARSFSTIFGSGKELDQRIFAALEAAGVFANLPIGSSQIARTGKYIASGGLAEDVGEGRYSEVAEGLVFGERDNQPKSIVDLGRDIAEGNFP